MEQTYPDDIVEDDISDEENQCTIPHEPWVDIILINLMWKPLCLMTDQDYNQRLFVHQDGNQRNNKTIQTKQVSIIDMTMNYILRILIENH